MRNWLKILLTLLVLGAVLAQTVESDFRERLRGVPTVTIVLTGATLIFTFPLILLFRKSHRSLYKILIFVCSLLVLACLLPQGIFQSKSMLLHSRAEKLVLRIFSAIKSEKEIRPYFSKELAQYSAFQSSANDLYQYDGLQITVAAEKFTIEYQEFDNILNLKQKYVFDGIKGTWRREDW